jgi:hypothetical protein
MSPSSIGPYVRRVLDSEPPDTYSIKMRTSGTGVLADTPSHSYPKYFTCDASDAATSDG